MNITFPLCLIQEILGSILGRILIWSLLPAIAVAVWQAIINRKGPRALVWLRRLQRILFGVLIVHTVNVILAYLFVGIACSPFGF